MLSFKFILLVFILSQCEVIDSTAKCECNQLKSKADCLAQTCSWGIVGTNTTESCFVSTSSSGTTPTSSLSVLCTKLLNPAGDCSSTSGCAYYQGKCTQFAGCRAYLLTSNSECQTVSQQCTTNGVSCMDPLQCAEYQTEALCASNKSASGSKKCVWTGAACRDQTCEEADISNTSDSKCGRFMSGCVTTGKGCTTLRQECNKYTSDCEVRVGSDGYCENGASTACQVKDCSKAPKSAISDSECSLFQFGCITTGRGCIKPPLPACSTYTGTYTECQMQIGSDGKCDGEQTGTANCKARACDLAAATNNTDELCGTYLSGCVTKGVGCVIARQPCSSYSGGATECQNYRGSDGLCTGLSNSSSSGPCRAKVCTEAPTTYNTDVQCSAYQYGCVTNGRGCVASRSLCASYTGSQTECQSYLGSDGYCDGTGTTGNPCFLKVCSQAPDTYTSQELCSKYQTNCVTTGSGCIQSTTCLATQKQLACQNTPNCTWNKVCVDGTQCTNFTTVALCLNNKGGGKDCFWTGSLCRDKQCTDAPNTYSSIVACDSFMSGCRTTLTGCIAPTQPCSAYTGTQTQCNNFIGNGILCYRNDATSGACRDRLCADNTTSALDGDCEAFLSGCRTNGAGCIPKSEPCTTYKGTKQTCLSFSGENGTKKCSNDASATAITPCRNLKCNDDVTQTTNDACGQVMLGCLTTGAGCISPTEPCSSYPSNGTGEKCSTFVGNSKKCWFVSGANCTDKLCTHNTTATTDSECSNFLEGCLTNGAGCIASTAACSTYSGNETTCLKFKGDSKPCHRYNSCVDRACADVSNPTSQSICTTYLSTCRFNGTACIAAQAACNNYLNMDASICQQLTTTSAGACWLPSGVGACVVKDCSHKGSATSQGDCDTFLPNACIFSGSICVAKNATCTGYTNFTQDACKNAVNSSGTKCWKDAAGLGTCEDRSCSNTVTSPSVSNCPDHKSSCVYSGTGCVDKQALCASYTSFTQSACKAVTTTGGEKCWREDGGSGACSSRACSNTVTSPNAENCTLHKSSCRYNGTSCVDAQATCAGYTSFTQAACQAASLSDGTTYCWRVSSSNGTCEDRSCVQTISNPSKDNCIAHKSTCRYDGSNCVDNQASCAAYTSFSQAACQAVTKIDGVGCWKSTAAVGACEERICGNPVPTPNVANCATHKSTCRYSGTICVDAGTSCNTYSNFTQDACRQVTLLDGTKCWKTSTSSGYCESRSCDNNVPNPSESVCTAHLTSCVYNGVSCQTGQGACSGYTSMQASQCQTIKTLSGGLCWLNQGVGTCLTRQCEHNTTATSNEECVAFMSGCKTNGNGCVPSTTTCSQMTGTQSVCLSINCKGQQTAGPCSTRVCSDNQDATTDSDCAGFLSGCVTKGKGCIPATSTCSSYQGTRLTCQNFVGNGRKCWNSASATATTQCVERQCEDDVASTTDQACQSFQSGCVTKGLGCILATLGCSSYYGTQATCANFKGNGSTPCYNVSTATSTTACVDKLCTHDTRATTDIECQQFMNGCVTKGSGCTAPQPCSMFIGTIKTCPKFTATDKPCKGVANTIDKCVSQTCEDAPTTYTTDQLCNNFKSGCVTNGHGCQSSIACQNVITENACLAKSGCLFVGNCQIIQTECNVFTNATLCSTTPVNTSTKKCTWQNNICRDWDCQDAPETTITEASCQLLNSKCTLKGKGCITTAPCSTYTTSTICGSARSTDPSGTCVWEGVTCRPRKCEDASLALKTDDACNTYLTNCKTSGQGCITPPFTCQSIATQDRCTKDYTDSPCLWLTTTSKCINFTKCIDIIKQTHADCQNYSPYCTSDGVNCIPLSLCTSYTNPTSCVIGNDGTCGWVAATITTPAKCSKFEKCSDVTATTTTACKAFNSNCVTDGTACVKYDKCETYKTKNACDNGGTDGQCQWSIADTLCRLRVCKDADSTNSVSITTYEGCSVFKATTPCTTNGTGCIETNLCSSYVEASCHKGTDGDCIFTFPVGQVQGTQICRLKLCSDIQKTTTADCNAALAKCISDGTTCLSKGLCSTYTTIVACNSGGTDGTCVFTASSTDAQKGTCSLMTKCADANSDKYACQLNSSCNYKAVVSSGQEVTSCEVHTCASISVAGTCVPLPSFDGKHLSICIPTAQGCTLGDTAQLASSNCYPLSNKAFSWNSALNQCIQCQPTTDPTTPTPTDSTNSTDKTTFGSILMLSTLLLFIE